MNTQRSRRAFGLLLGAALAAASCAVAAQQPAVPWKTWKVAERNTGSYGTDTEYVVTREETTWNGKPAVLFTRSTGGKIVAPPGEARWHALLGPDGQPVATWEPPIGFDLPLRPGATSGRDHLMVWKDGAVTFSYSCTVGTIEKVTVRAGTFDAYRVECRSGGSAETYWYSPAVEQVVKTRLRRAVGSVMGEGTQEAELIEGPR